MKPSFIIVFHFLFLSGFCQKNLNDTLIFKEGGSPFRRVVFYGMDKTYPIESMVEGVAYCNVNMKVDRNGQIQAIDVFTIGDSIFSKMAYDGLMQTNGRWSTSNNDNRVFNVLFYYKYDKGDNEPDNPQKYFYEHFGSNSQEKVTRFGIFTVTRYPTVR